MVIDGLTDFVGDDGGRLIVIPPNIFRALLFLRPCSEVNISWSIGEEK